MQNRRWIQHASQITCQRSHSPEFGCRYTHATRRRRRHPYQCRRWPTDDTAYVRRSYSQGCRNGRPVDGATGTVTFALSERLRRARKTRSSTVGEPTPASRTGSIIYAYATDHGHPIEGYPCQHSRYCDNRLCSRVKSDACLSKASFARVMLIRSSPAVT